MNLNEIVSEAIRREGLKESINVAQGSEFLRVLCNMFPAFYVHGQFPQAQGDTELPCTVSVGPISLADLLRKAKLAPFISPATKPINSEEVKTVSYPALPPATEYKKKAKKKK